MNFCKNCNNCLYPTEMDNELWLICKTCEYKEEPTNTVIKKNVYKRSNTLHYGTNRYLIYDKSYPRTKQMPCPNTECPSATDSTLQEAIYYNDSQNLKITYICVACNTEWKPN